MKIYLLLALSAVALADRRGGNADWVIPKSDGQKDDKLGWIDRRGYEDKDCDRDRKWDDNKKDWDPKDKDWDRKGNNDWDRKGNNDWDRKGDKDWDRKGDKDWDPKDKDWGRDGARPHYTPTTWCPTSHTYCPTSHRTSHRTSHTYCPTSHRTSRHHSSHTYCPTKHHTSKYCPTKHHTSKYCPTKHYTSKCYSTSYCPTKCYTSKYCPTSYCHSNMTVYCTSYWDHKMKKYCTKTETKYIKPRYGKTYCPTGSSCENHVVAPVCDKPTKCEVRTVTVQAPVRCNTIVVCNPILRNCPKATGTVILKKLHK